jgi:malate dehydrogenase
VCAITGAAGRVAYNLLFRLASGEIFGPKTPVALRLVDVDEALPALAGTVMELEDCSFPLLAEIDATSDYETGFSDASWVLMLGAPRRTAGMERGDLLALTAESFTHQGKAVQDAAADVRVVVVGNPANTNCLVARMSAPDVPDDRWTAMLRLDHNRARALLADHVDVPLESVRRISVWGNHSPTMVPDAWHATVAGRAASDLVDEEWLASDYVPAVQNRGAELIEVSGASSAASAASALADHIHDLTEGTRPADWTTLGVISRGEYGVPPGLVFGFPVTVEDGSMAVAADLEVGPLQRRLLERTIGELADERTAATRILSGGR